MDHLGHVEPREEINDLRELREAQTRFQAPPAVGKGSASEAEGGNTGRRDSGR